MMLLIARMTMIASSASIITLVTRSRPLCSPNELIKKPATTTITMQMAMTPGWLSISGNAASTPAVSSPSNLPAAI